MSTSEVHCRNCVHYYVTWDKDLPYGCRLFQMRTMQPPMFLVKKESGKDCQGFRAKKKQKEHSYFENND